MPALLIALLVLALLVVLVLWSGLNTSRRAEFIRSEPLPKGLYDMLRARHPSLSHKDCQLVAQGLRQFFLAYLKGGRKTVSMPSQVVDDLWHEFILHTRSYEGFCRRAFGGFLHHTPAVALAGSARKSNEGLRRVWWQACRAENINARSPSRLPLLFAIDAKLKIEGGFHYLPDCGPLRNRAAATHSNTVVVHCGGDFSSSSIDGSTDGFGDGGGSGDGSGDGGGCGGGGCSD